MLRGIALLTLAAGALCAQVYSPKLLREGQPDSTDLKKFAQAIYTDAGAHTERERAAAIWRFFLTDGRFVKPGFWYHIAGWTYEEPAGEVLDPIKLLNSYGFGLCYHIAPLLEAVWEAGGFADARCWFLTGHTVAEVFYEGAYHYFDSDMMGYNVAGGGSFRGKPVVSVRDLERNGDIILGKLRTPNEVNPGSVDAPWYPADVRASAMGDLAGLFTTTADNYLYPYTRYSPGHSMDFVLRPGEKLIRFFKPEEPGVFYLPYKFDGEKWSEFPREFSEYKISTADGPRSQKDARQWATGRIEYAPPGRVTAAATVIDMPSPYVIIDARFTMNVELASADSFLQVETSTDGGQTWQLAGEAKGPRHGAWATEPGVLAAGAHGRLTSVSGRYGYKVRLTLGGARTPSVSALRLVSRIQLNPRTLPEIRHGENRFSYSAAASVQRLPISTPLAKASTRDLELVDEHAQQFLHPSSRKMGEAVFSMDAGGKPLSGFEAGVRFFDLDGGLAPDKLTAETRHTIAVGTHGAASLSWSTSQAGPFHELWAFPEKLEWRDDASVDRLLLWPEVFRQVQELPAGITRIYLKVRTAGPAFDNVRMALYSEAEAARGDLTITQTWREGQVRKQHVERVSSNVKMFQYAVRAGPDVQNEAVVFSNE